MNYNEKVVVVISTFNRKELLRQCIASVLKQTVKPSKIIVVDGPSSDGTDMLVKTEFPFIHYVRLNSDLGGSVQFYIGIKVALRSDFDWLWIMDDDAEVVVSDALKILLDATRELKTKGLPVGAVIPLQLINGKPAQVGPFSIFVGGLISREAILKIGLPKHDFFIYYDDVEYSYRLLKAGFIIRYVPPIIEHRGWMAGRRACIGLRKNYCLPLLNCKKIYYLTRNGIVFAISYRLVKLLLRILGGSLIRMFLHSIMLNDIYVSLCIARGVVEGLIGITGKRHK